MPTSWLTSLPPICVYRNLFGVECPSCGLTRAFSSVLHGQLSAAWNYNHLVVIAFPALAVVAVRNVRSLLGAAVESPGAGGASSL